MAFGENIYDPTQTYSPYVSTMALANRPVNPQEGVAKPVPRTSAPMAVDRSTASRLLSGGSGLSSQLRRKPGVPDARPQQLGASTQQAEDPGYWSQVFSNPQTPNSYTVSGPAANSASGAASSGAAAGQAQARYQQEQEQERQRKQQENSRRMASNAQQKYLNSQTSMGDIFARRNNAVHNKAMGVSNYFSSTPQQKAPQTMQQASVGRW